MVLPENAGSITGADEVIEDTDLSDFVAYGEAPAPALAPEVEGRVIQPPRHEMTAAIAIPLVRRMVFHSDGTTEPVMENVVFPERGTF